jgi:Phage tail tube protein
MQNTANPEVARIHGRWGELLIGGVAVAEATQIEYTVEIGQIDVPQVGGNWVMPVDGPIRGTGTLTLVQAYSSFRDIMFETINLSVAQMRAIRDSLGVAHVRKLFVLNVVLDDPASYGREVDILDGVKFTSYTGGWNLDDLVNRAYPFNFRGISSGGSIAGSPTYTFQT